MNRSIKRKIISGMVFGVFGLISMSFGTNAHAEPLNREVISTTITHEDFTVQETIIPLEIAEKWFEENDSEENFSQLKENVLSEIGLSLISPIPELEPQQNEEISTYAAGAPSLISNLHDVSKARYPFSGTFKSSNALFTNKAMKGKTTYSAYVENYYNTSLGVQAKTLTSTILDRTLMKQSITLYTIKTSKTSTPFYLKFYPVNGAGGASGHIK